MCYISQYYLLTYLLTLILVYWCVCVCVCVCVDLPRPVASVDVPRLYETPQEIDSEAGAFRLTKFRRSNAVGLVHLIKVLCTTSCYYDVCV